MKLLRGMQSLREPQPGCVATIGNFDGVHLGHAAVIGSVVEQARRKRLRACVITFEPLPQEFFHTIDAPPRLMRLREKFKRIGILGADDVLVLNFNAALARLEPEAFVDRVLLNGLNVKHLVVGDDFRFGKARRGDMALLNELAATHDFDVSPTQTFCNGAHRVSSTRVRELLANGDFAGATQLLGEPYAISGRVGYGQRLAQTLGFATANVDMGRVRPPMRGVFAVQAMLADKTPMRGVANLGTRPTVNGVRLVLEVHCFDFAGDIYGQRLTVTFLHKLRDEQKFASLEDLQRQVHVDRETAHAYFTRA
ncbi:MAG: bifunctional riboflavin kinase/FAD synthetase [Gammaproteobacteria bacterium]|nr:bifunctional riboflavin kinase/FAD synthetase [Gammaproteobacteria bacterium]